jgi:hypothetical protein
VHPSVTEDLARLWVTCDECGLTWEAGFKCWRPIGVLEGDTLTLFPEAPEPKPRPQTVEVHWVDGPPKGTVRVSETRYDDLLRERSYVLWRNRWCVVWTKGLHIFDRLDAWLQDPNHGLEWQKR